MRYIFLISLSMLFFVSCDETINQTGSGGSGGNGGGSVNSGPWTIPISQVFDGGPGRDGIPALTDPQRTNVDGGSYILDPELVLGYYDGNKAIAYPHQILDWHEIINDQLNDFSYAITYCPLTGTGIGWDSNVDGSELTFAVSGLIYNNNLIPFDRETNSNWSQLRLDCVNGPLINSRIKTFPLVETRWSTWKEMYPDTEVLTLNTGHDRTYGVYPYGDYRVNENNLLFPLSFDDRRLNRKERVHGIISTETTRVYRFDSFGLATTLIHDVIDDTEVIIIGDAGRNYIVSFYAELEDGSKPDFTTINDGSLILEDSEGNKWDIFGFAVEGPRVGQQLIRTESFMGYWFAWGTFYQGVEIFE